MIILQFKVHLFKVFTRVVHAVQSTYFNRTANQVIVRLVVLVNQFSTSQRLLKLIWKRYHWFQSHYKVKKSLNSLGFN